MSLYYTDSHEWFNQTNFNVGISRFAKHELGEIVYLKLPEVGQKVQKGEELAILESTKSALDVYAPYSGTITKINAQAIDFINEDPEAQGWLCEITPDSVLNLQEFLDHSNYKQLLGL